MIQLQFLNKLLDTQDPSLILVNNLDESFFSDYKSEYRYIKEHLDKYNTIPDRISFLDKFPEFDIIQVNEGVNYLVDELFLDKQKRYLADVFNKVRDLLNSGKTEEAISLYTSAADVAIKAKHMQCTDLITDTSRYDAYVERCTDFTKYYVKTGFKELDDVIGGWDREEELATLVARPGVGKTWCMLRSAVASLEQGLNVGVYSGEMSARKVGYRFDTLVSHISNYGITKGVDTIQNNYKMYIDSLPSRFRGSLKVLTPTDIDGPAGVTALRAFIEKENLDILFVDQHSLLEDDRKGRSPVEKASNISKDLKNLQVLKHIPIIAVSQQNRSATDEGAVLDVSRIAQADRIGQDSTVVLFFEQKDNVLTMHIAKSRDSDAGKKISYAIDLDKGIFNYIPEEDNALDGAGCEELAQEYGDVEGDYF
ncbi:MAG: DnaB-like helicase C-terminal domain-containing protein [Candidatus Gastranaerophilaceae bacterium]